jgi:hypothetical protein
VSKLDWLALLLILTSLVVLGGLMLLISFVAYDAIGEILDIVWGGNASGGNAESPPPSPTLTQDGDQEDVLVMSEDLWTYGPYLSLKEE